MSDPTSTTPGTAVAVPAPKKPLHPAAAAAKAVREITLQIRGQTWGAGLSREFLDAIARYALRFNIDAVRHIDILGGKIYLNGEWYEEKGAPLVIDGTVQVSEPDYVHHDDRLQKLAGSSDEAQAAWAHNEIFRRLQSRIEYGIPDDATAACIYRGTLKNGTTLVGFNWCGGATKIKTKSNGEKFRSDPIGDAEPTKTAQSRAKRRMWRQVVVNVPVLANTVGDAEAGARQANVELEQIAKTEAALGADIKAGTPSHPTPLLNPGDNPYGAGEVRPAAEPVVTSNGEAVEPKVRTVDVSLCPAHDITVPQGRRCPECEREEIELAGQ